MRRIPREAVAWASGAIIAAGAGAAGVGYAVGAGHQAGTLRSFWTAGRANMLDKGAITGFEAGHGMPTDGVAGRAVWAALLKAAATGKGSTHGYSYAIASQHTPERLTIWHNGHRVFSSLANTGISIAPTPVGSPAQPGAVRSVTAGSAGCRANRVRTSGS